MNKNRLQPMHAILLLTMMLMVGGVVRLVSRKYVRNKPIA